MGIASAYLNWTPSDFWRATPWEFNAALDGLMEKLGVRAKNPMKREEFMTLLEKHGEPETKKRLKERKP